MSEKQLIKNILEKLPYDVIYEIYLYCPIKEKRQLIKQFCFKKSLILLCIIILFFSCYIVGYLFTNNLYGTSFVFLNIFIGYLVLITLMATIAFLSTFLEIIGIYIYRKCSENIIRFM